jgi:putative transposase
MRKIESASDFKIDEMEVDVDHLHLMILSTPSLSPMQIVRKLKQESTIYMRKLFSMELRTYFWKEKTFWADGYFVSSIGEASAETLRHYIQIQE